MNYVILALQVLIGVFFLTTAFQKLTKSEYMVKEFEQFGYGYGIAYFAGAIEIVVAPLLLIGVIYEGLAGLGALLAVPLMIGATFVNFTKRDAKYGFIVTFMFLLPVALIAWYRFDAFYALFTEFLAQ